MWTSCCNWFCLDTATVEESNSSMRHQAYTNSGYSSYPSPPLPEHTCKACGSHFVTLARKHVCVDCKKNYCGSCSAQLEPRQRLCHTCQRFHGTLFERTELMKLKTPSVLLPLGPEEPLDTEGDTELQGEQELQVLQHDPAIVVLMEKSSDTDEVLAPGRRASLSDLATADDIEALSVRQLKEILARNFVNYKGCCEKWELMERVTRLYHDQKDLQNLVSSTNDGTGCFFPCFFLPDPSGTPGQEENLCKICMDSPIDCVLLECGHMVTCTKCGKRMNECPICRQYVVRAVHIFRA
ncbi:E3 ubiquitin-protein ligase rififylin isoform X6 [Oncorhynchus mykiss]|uniref:E3 ubiquitin-protein ligase rififylin isoform X6 n=1 Tax=Oncorhynchus mykiss TaxID=8022 RepID=UPI0018789F74|nr:E3 ubiquitin-protein ligase rififylin isoform X6 [Oncorhynchus mykiss]